MEEIKYTIYKLIDPVSNDIRYIRYIGLTFNTLKQRLFIFDAYIHLTFILPKNIRR